MNFFVLQVQLLKRLQMDKYVTTIQVGWLVCWSVKKDKDEEETRKVMKGSGVSLA